MAKSIPHDTKVESTTRTGIGDVSAAIIADSKVPDSFADRWMETMPSAPSSASRW